MVTLANLADLKRYDIARDDQVRFKVSLRRSEFPDYPALRDAILACAAAEGWFVKSVELIPAKENAPKRVDAVTSGLNRIATTFSAFDDYCKRKQVDDELRRIGLDLLK